jgi:hypothetical protein
VTVIDSTPPAFTSVPAAVTASTGEGATACGAIVADSALGSATASDNCGGVTVTRSGVPAGNLFPVGVATVTYTATDAAGLTATATQTVTVVDATRPQLTCPANVIRPTDAGQCSAVVSYAAPVATDNCPSANVTCSPPSGSSFPRGTTIVTCTATDSAHNQRSCAFTVTVNDAQQPAIACPAAITKSADPNLCSAVVTFPAPQVSDNCAGAGAPVCAPPSGTAFPVGTTTVTCAVTDAAGNSNSCGFAVTVVDAQPPLVICPPNQTAVASSPTAPGAVVNYPAPAASDNCPGVTVLCAPPSGSSFALGTTTVTCTAQDASGNRASCSFTVQVWNVCLQDELTGNTLRLNFNTGEYVFCRRSDGWMLSGVGTVLSNQGCYFELRHQAQDRQVTARIYKCANYGSGAISALQFGFTTSLMDGSLTNNSCLCP